MRSRRCYVFDTNTLVSAALFEGGTPDRAFRHALRSGTVVLSQPTFEEMDEVLAREKFDDYLSLEERAAFIEALVKRSRFADPSEQVQVCRDPDDDKFLEFGIERECNLHRQRRREPAGAEPVPRHSDHAASRIP